MRQHTDRLFALLSVAVTAACSDGNGPCEPIVGEYELVDIQPLDGNCDEATVNALTEFFRGDPYGLLGPICVFRSDLCGMGGLRWEDVGYPVDITFRQDEMGISNAILTTGSSDGTCTQRYSLRYDYAKPLGSLCADLADAGLATDAQLRAGDAAQAALDASK